jgi:GTP-binding protein EngB required for normal cell division
MTAVETLRRLTGQPSDVVERLAGLNDAANAARGRLDDGLVDAAAQIVERAGGRLRLSSEHTVVAIAGATGSGKSSLFNWLCDLDLAAVGVKRPTTSWALACSWGPAGAGELLDWLEIPKRHQVNRMGMLDETAADRELQGLVLLDLPDHDSTEVAHHLEVQRLVQLADVLIWVLDPQKYADAAIHDRFLRPLASHAEVMMVALNHVDEISDDDLRRCMSDVRRLLADDGLGSVPTFATSARRGDGLQELRQALAERVAAKQLARERLTADITAAAARLGEVTGDAKPPNVRESARGDLLDAAADAAAVPIVVEGIRASSLSRARRMTGWPLTSWVGRLRRNRLRALDLPEPSDGRELLTAADVRAVRGQLPEPMSVQEARLDAAVREIADHVTAGMGPAWEQAVRSASVGRVSQYAAGLDEAVAQTDLGLSSQPWWWRGAQILQWLFFLTAVGGLGWVVGAVAASMARDPDPVVPKVGGVWWPTALVAAGLAAGLVVALICGLAVRVSAAHRAQRADARLREAIQRVTDIVVVDPMQDVIDAYVRCRDGVAQALRP